MLLGVKCWPCKLPIPVEGQLCWYLWEESVSRLWPGVIHSIQESGVILHPSYNVRERSNQISFVQVGYLSRNSEIELIT